MRWTAISIPDKKTFDRSLSYLFTGREQLDLCLGCAKTLQGSVQEVTLSRILSAANITVGELNAETTKLRKDGHAQFREKGNRVELWTGCITLGEFMTTMRNLWDKKHPSEPEDNSA